MCLVSCFRNAQSPTPIFCLRSSPTRPNNEVLTDAVREGNVVFCSDKVAFDHIKERLRITLRLIVVTFPFDVNSFDFLGHTLDFNFHCIVFDFDRYFFNYVTSNAAARSIFTVDHNKVNLECQLFGECALQCC